MVHWNRIPLLLISWLLLTASPAFAHSTEEVHRPLADKAWDKMGLSPTVSDPATAKGMVKDGSVDEDKGSYDCDPYGRSSNHGYNPLWNQTGGIFLGVTAKQRAVDLWNSMKQAFSSGNFYGGDDSGGYHFLGRVSHLVHDMSSPPHILWGDVQASHDNYEKYWAEDIGGKTRWQDWWDQYGSNLTGGPLKPTDPLPSWAMLKLDSFSMERLNYRWNQAKADTIEGYIDTLAWMTYFRATLWGEIRAGDDNPAPLNTTATTADGVSIGEKANSLRTMFGEGNIIFTKIGISGYHFWTINDAQGNLHYYEAETVTDDWWPLEGPFPEGSYEEGDKSRYTGRFYFSTPAPYDGPVDCLPDIYSWDGVWPRNWPDGSSASGNLAWYYGWYLFPLTVQYNAGLLGLAHPEITINVSPREQNLIFNADQVSYKGSGTFRWPIKSPHDIAVSSPQKGEIDGVSYTFSHWSDGGERAHKIYPEQSGIYTAYFQSPLIPATLISPSGTITDTTPTYTWNAVSNSTWYYLWVNDSTGIKIQQWYRASEAGCAPGTGTCSVTPSTVLVSGAAKWWIQTYNSGGYGPWSAPMAFTVQGPGLPGAATLVTPSGTISDTTPTYTWNAVSNSTWYYLWVDDSTGTKIQQWYRASEAGCASGTGTCSVTPSSVLVSGTAKWWIQTYNSDGYGPWSKGMSFTVLLPGAATPISPSGTISDCTPTYTWSAAPGSTWYYLWINGSTGIKFQHWYRASEAGCASGTGICSVTPDPPLAAGQYTWWIQTWINAREGPWSSGMTFILTPPGAATLVSPSGTITTATPAYSWNAVPDSTWYYLWVNDSTGNKIQQWYRASEAGCGSGTGTCSVTPITELANGAGKWWIQTYSNAGYGPWSQGVSFTVSPP